MIASRRTFFFTMTAARFSQCGRRMTFAAACQPPAILISKGTLRLLDSQNGILGYLPEIAPSESDATDSVAGGFESVKQSSAHITGRARQQNQVGIIWHFSSGSTLSKEQAPFRRRIVPRKASTLPASHSGRPLLRPQTTEGPSAVVKQSLAGLAKIPNQDN